jgi:RNA polymerase sigma-70 factor (ECF subfamily)
MKKTGLPFISKEHLLNEKRLQALSKDEKPEKQLANILDDEAILRNTFKNNPEEGFEMVFRRYYKPLCSHAVRYVYSKEIAEDIVSEVFVNFWKKNNYENVRISYRAYLYQALRNTIYNYLKSEYGKRANSFLSINNEIDEVKEESTPQKMLLFDELSGKIKETVNAFPPQCQRVFILSRYEGKKNREIAEELNIKLKTVEAHMMKALSALKNSLANYLK